MQVIPSLFSGAMHAKKNLPRGIIQIGEIAMLHITCFEGLAMFRFCRLQIRRSPFGVGHGKSAFRGKETLQLSNR